MNRSFSQSPRSNDVLAWIFMALGVLLMVLQLPELLRSSRVPIAWGTDSGTSYGPPWMVVAGPWCVVLAIGILWAGRRARIEVDSEGMVQYGLFREKGRVRWREITRITVETVSDEGRKYGSYTVHSDNSSVRFSELTRDWKDLLRQVLQFMPAGADRKGVAEP